LMHYSFLAYVAVSVFLFICKREKLGICLGELFWCLMAEWLWVAIFRIEDRC
jgi:hypothetical protein